MKQNGLENLYVRIRDDKIVAKLLEQAKVAEGQPESKTKAKAADKKESGGKLKAEAEAEQAPDEAADAKPAKPKRTPPKKRKASDDAADAT